MNNWTYIPEFTKAPNGEIVRGEPPKFVHSSSAMIDIAATTCLAADMLDVEEKPTEAADVRAMAAGDFNAFLRIFQFERPPTCACGSGWYPWWQTTEAGRVRVCDRCMKREELQP